MMLFNVNNRRPTGADCETYEGHPGLRFAVDTSLVSICSFSSWFASAKPAGVLLSSVALDPTLILPILGGLGLVGASCFALSQGSAEVDGASSATCAVSTTEHFTGECQVSLAPWSSGGFTLMETLTTSVNGEVRHATSTRGRGVAKVVCKTGNTSSLEDLQNEVAVLTFISLSMPTSLVIDIFGAFEDTSAVYLVVGYCEGGDLLEYAQGGPKAFEVRRYMREILQGVQHLHKLNIGHRDLSLENVLLRNGSCVLCDFGQAVPLKRPDGSELRYFEKAGKDMYRAPEMNFPEVQVLCPHTSACNPLLGYAAAPADVWAVGVIAFILAVAKPPWDIALDTDLRFRAIRRIGVKLVLQKIGPASLQSEQGSLVADMLHVCPADRSTAEQLLMSSWLVD